MNNILNEESFTELIVIKGSILKNTDLRHSISLEDSGKTSKGRSTSVIWKKDHNLKNWIFHDFNVCMNNPGIS